MSSGGGLASHDTLLNVVKLVCALRPEDVIHSFIVLGGVQDSLYFGKEDRSGAPGKTANIIFHEIDRFWNDMTTKISGGVIITGNVPAGLDGFVIYRNLYRFLRIFS